MPPYVNPLVQQRALAEAIRRETIAGSLAPNGTGDMPVDIQSRVPLLMDALEKTDRINTKTYNGWPDYFPAWFPERYYIDQATKANKRDRDILNSRML